MSENENQQSTIATHLCKNGCGFYGSTQFDGMCSVCHKENMKKRQRLDEDQIQKPTSSPHAAAALLCAATSSSLQASFGGTAVDPAEAANTNEDCHHGAVASAAAATAASAILPPSSGAAEAASVSSSVTSTTQSSGSTLDSSQQKRRIRCVTCKKKVGLTGFNCRCGGVYCSTHRYSDKHDCDFDYQSHGQEQIRKANPQVVSSKIEKL